MTTLGGIANIVFSGEVPEEAKTITILGDEKSGKSVLTTQLMDWPSEGGRPLVLATDARGVEACAEVGVKVPNIKIRDQAGANIIEKMDGVIRDLRVKWRKFDPKNPTAFPFTTVVWDCASSYGQEAMRDIDEFNKNPDQRSDYAVLAASITRIFYGLRDLGVPVIIYAWWRKSQKVDNRLEEGGAEIPGKKWSKAITGLADQVLILEKSNGTPKGEFLCPDGFDRKLHGRMYQGTPAGGRYQSRLNPVEPADLGTVLAKLMKLI